MQTTITSSQRQGGDDLSVLISAAEIASWLLLCEVSMKRKRERDKTATPTAEKWLSEKGSADNRERVFFPYRLGDDKTEYVDNVIKTLREKVKRHNSIAVVIAFVKGIPASYAKEVAERVAVRIEKEIDYDTNEKAFVIKPYIDISIGVIRELKGKGKSPK